VPGRDATRDLSQSHPHPILLDRACMWRLGLSPLKALTSYSSLPPRKPWFESGMVQTGVPNGSRSDPPSTVILGGRGKKKGPHRCANRFSAQPPAGRCHAALTRYCCWSFPGGACVAESVRIARVCVCVCVCVSRTVDCG